MSANEFDARVLAHIRKFVPEGDVEASVSFEFAERWLEANKDMNAALHQPGDIHMQSGASDGAGTLTYLLNMTLTGLAITIPTNPRPFGDALVVDVSPGVFPEG